MKVLKPFSTRASLGMCVNLFTAK